MKCKYNERKTAKKEQVDAIILTTLNHTKTYKKNICKQKRINVSFIIFSQFFLSKVLKKHTWHNAT